MKKIFLLSVLFFNIAQSQSTEENLFCQKCGVEQTVANKFCNSCGVKLDKTIIIDKIESKIDSLYQKGEFPLSKQEIAILVEYYQENSNDSKNETPVATKTISPILNLLVPIVTIGLFLIIIFNKHNLMKTFFRYFLIIIFATSFVFSQTDKTIICKFCKTKNKTNNTFCINCGKTLSTSTQSKEINPLATHKLDHLFSIPKAEMLKSLDVNFMLGGAWGLEEQNSFLGSFALGLGDVAQIEVGTIGMIGNLLGLSNISTIGLKGIIFHENEKWPSIALALRSSNDWDYNSLSENEVQANSPSDYASGLRDYNYEMRFTSLSLILSKNVGDKNSLHFGASYMDTRYRNLYRYIYNNPFYQLL